MAIASFEYAFLGILARRGLLPHGGTVLELGEQHWHGDVAYEQLLADIRERIGDAAKAHELVARAQALRQSPTGSASFDLVKVLYEALCAPTSVVSVDRHGSERAIDADLNEPLNLGRQFDVVLNIGTGEHVFDVRRFFESIHDHAAPHALMVHVMPFHGWVDHGFYTFQPTFYWDLAAANGYAVEALYLQAGDVLAPMPAADALEAVLHRLSDERRAAILRASNIYAALRQGGAPARFSPPMQGYFRQSRAAYAEDVHGRFQER